MIKMTGWGYSDQGYLMRVQGLNNAMLIFAMKAVRDTTADAGVGCRRSLG